MASYTDDPKALSTFNPYIKELPVDSMVQVGMAKQQAYDTNVAAVQAKVDSLDDIDIANPIGRAYYQKKLNELNSNLKGFMAADFSQNQMAQSAMSLTKIGDDPYIKNAITSTAKFRKEQAAMEADRKKGELYAANEWHFNKGASKWLGSDDLDNTFNSSYIKGFDKDKFTREQFAALKPDEINTNDLYDKNGKMLKIEQLHKIKGIFGPKVVATIDNIMADTRMQQQMAIEAEYVYKNSDGQELAERLRDGNLDQIRLYEDKKAESYGTGDTDTANKFAEKIKDLEEQNVSLQNGDIPAASIKSNYYAKKTMANYANMYSYKETEETSKLSPLFEFETHNQQFYAKMRQDDAQFNANLGLKKQELELRRDANDIAREKAKTDKASKDLLSGVTTTSDPVDIVGGVTEHEEAVNTRNNTARDANMKSMQLCADIVGEIKGKDTSFNFKNIPKDPILGAETIVKEVQKKFNLATVQEAQAKIYSLAKKHGINTKDMPSSADFQKSYSKYKSAVSDLKNKETEIEDLGKGLSKVTAVPAEDRVTGDDLTVSKKDASYYVVLQKMLSTYGRDSKNKAVNDKIKEIEGILQEKGIVWGSNQETALRNYYNNSKTLFGDINVDKLISTQNSPTNVQNSHTISLDKPESQNNAKTKLTEMLSSIEQLGSKSGADLVDIATYDATKMSRMSVKIKKDGNVDLYVGNKDTLKDEWVGTVPKKRYDEVMGGTGAGALIEKRELDLQINQEFRGNVKNIQDTIPTGEYGNKDSYDNDFIKYNALQNTSAPGRDIRIIFEPINHQTSEARYRVVEYDNSGVPKKVSKAGKTVVLSNYTAESLQFLMNDPSIPAILDAQ